jgi:uncharacterized Zn finger protein
MGWCSGTDVFDDIVEQVLDMKIKAKAKAEIIAVVVDALENHDWDCQGESAYFEHPIVQAAMQKLHPDWAEDEE